MRRRRSAPHSHHARLPLLQTQDAGHVLPAPLRTVSGQAGGVGVEDAAGEADGEATRGVVTRTQPLRHHIIDKPNRICSLQRKLEIPIH